MAFLGKPRAVRSPIPEGALLAAPGLGAVPFQLAGGLKIADDLLLYRGFKTSQVGASGESRRG